MDRFRGSGTFNKPPVHAGRSEPIELLLSALPGGESGEPVFNERDRQDIHTTSFLWVTPHTGQACGAGRICDQSQACRASHASHGNTGSYTGSAYEQSSSVSSGLPLSTAGDTDNRTGQGMVCRYNVHTHGSGVYVSGRHHGLVQQVCAGMGAVQQPGKQLLCRSLETGIGAKQSRNIQHGSGFTVYVSCFYQFLEGRSYQNKHGRSWQGNGQHIYRTTVVERKVRGGVSERVQQRPGSSKISFRLLPFLQHRTSSPKPWKSHTERNVQEIITLSSSPRGEEERKNPSFKEKKSFIQYTLTYTVFCPKDGGKGTPLNNFSIFRSNKLF